MNQRDWEASHRDCEDPLCRNSTDPYVGRNVGNFRLVRKLGEGGMGAAYLAEHQALALRAVVKTLIAGRHDPNLMERLRHEAHAMARLKLERVPRLLDFGEFADGIPYVVMEHVRGRSLAALLRETGPWQVRTALKLAARVADELTVVHEAGVIHRDIKPSNLVVDLQLPGEPSPYVIDFGIAKLSDSDQAASTSGQAVVGTPGYLSPEQASARGIDGRSDVFSLGVVLYELLTGALPFEVGTDLGATVQALFGGVLRRAGELRAAHLEPIPQEVEAILERALQRDPARRYTMAEFAQAMAAHIERADGVHCAVLPTGWSRGFAPSTAESPALAAGAEGVAEAATRTTGDLPSAARPDDATMPGHRRVSTQTVLSPPSSEARRRDGLAARW